MLKELLKEKDYLPVLKMNDGTDVTRERWSERRAEMLELLEKYSYGHTPKCPVKVSGKVTFTDKISYAGKVLNEKIDITFETEHGKTTFPIEIFVPYKVEKPPEYVNIFKATSEELQPVLDMLNAASAIQDNLMSAPE